MTPEPDNPQPTPSPRRRRRRRDRRRDRRRTSSPPPTGNPAPGAPGAPGTPTPPAPGEFPKTETPFCDVHKRPLYLNDAYRGASAFILLSGQSVELLDLEQLHRRGIVVFGINQSPSGFQTNFWTYVDRPRKFHSGIWRDPGVMKFVPSRHFGRGLMQKIDEVFRPIDTPDGRRPMVVRDMPGVIGYHRNATFRPEQWLSQSRINWGNNRKNARRNGFPRCLNVMFAVVKIAYSLGFRRLFLLGCDFYMDRNQPYFFDQYKAPGGCNSNNGSYSIMNRMFGELKPHFDRAGFEVYNCNPESGFTVFPHVSYAEAVAFVTRDQPAEPWDTTDWYECRKPKREKKEEKKE